MHDAQIKKVSQRFLQNLPKQKMYASILLKNGSMPHYIMLLVGICRQTPIHGAVCLSVSLSVSLLSLCFSADKSTMTEAGVINSSVLQRLSCSCDCGFKRVTVSDCPVFYITRRAWIATNMNPPA